MDFGNFGDMLRRLRKDKGLTQYELGKILGLSKQAISSYERKGVRPSPETLARLADFFNISLDELFNRKVEIARPEQTLSDAMSFDPSKEVPIPIYGEIRAGDPMFVNEEILGYATIPREEARNKEFFFLRVKGDSMINARICEGDLVLVERQNWIDNGDIGVFLINGEEATIKRYYEDKGFIILKPENPAYSPQIYRPEEVIILGRVAEIRIKRNRP